MATREPKRIKIVGFTPYSHQKAVIQLVEQHPTGSRIVVKSSRQKGKSILLNQLLIRQAINNPKTNSVLIEPTNAGCRRMLQDAIDCLSGIPIVKSANQQFNEITFVNGSSLLYRSAESEDGLRGISLKKNSLLAIDEGAFIQDRVYGIVLPFANTHNNTVIIVSTPKFKTGSFYDFYMKAKEGKPNFYLVDFNDYDTSMLITPEQLEMARETMSYQLFLNEYMGEFLEERGDVFGDFSGIFSPVPGINDGKVRVGIDWATGTNGDYTCVSAFNNNREQVFIDYFNNLTAPETIRRVVNDLRKLNPISVTVEANSIGTVNYDNLIVALRNEGLSYRVKKFQTTNESKRRIIDKLVTLVQTCGATFIETTEQKLEFAMYESQSTPKGGLTYNAKSGAHDDSIMASAIVLDEMYTKSAKYNIR